MMKILLAYESCALSRSTFGWALDLAKHYDAELHVLAVAEPPSPGEVLQMRDVFDESLARLEKDISMLLSEASKESVRCRSCVVVGNPADRILQYAEEERVNHLVVRQHTHRMLGRRFLGTVEKRMIVDSPCAFTVVPDEAMA